MTMRRKNPDWLAKARVQVRREMTRRMEAATRVMSAEVKSLLSVSGPGRGRKTKGRARSLPGEPPRVNTGALRKSVSSSVAASGNGVTGKVGAYRLVYAPIHEYGGTINFPAGRSWMVPAHVRKIRGIGKPVNVRAHTATRRKSIVRTMPRRPYIEPGFRRTQQQIRDIILRGRLS